MHVPFPDALVPTTTPFSAPELRVGATKEETESLLAEHNSFKEKAKETREKVKLLLQLADTLVEKGHAHAPAIRTWVQDVDATYKDFSTRMDQYRLKLEETLGIQGSEEEGRKCSARGVNCRQGLSRLIIFSVGDFNNTDF